MTKPFELHRRLRRYLPGLGGLGSPTYLLRDEFTTVQAAPLGASRTAEPGPGSWTTVQVNGQLSIDSQGLVVPVPAPTGWGNVGIYEPSAFTRATGMAFFWTYRSRGSDANALLGFSNAAGAGFTFDPGGAFFGGSGVISPIENGATKQISLFDSSTSVENRLAQVLIGTSGSYLFQEIDGLWTLIWHTPFGNVTTLRAAFGTFNTGFKVRYARRRQLPAPWTSDHGIAVVDVASPTHLTQYPATADAILRLTVTAPGTLANECGLRWRIQDANNYWRAYFNASGAFRIDSVSGGTPTNRLNVAGAISASQVRDIQIVSDASDHIAFTSTAGPATPHTRHGAINVSHLNLFSDVAVDVGATWSVSNLRVFPRRSGVYSELARV